MVSIQPNNMVSTASAYPNLLVYCCAVYLVFIIIFRLTNHNKLTTTQPKN
jgi:hypothetical protein